MEFINVLDCKDKDEFRLWLENNHDLEDVCWINCKKGKVKDDGEFYYIDAVYVALCYGWIDSTLRRKDGVLLQRFSPRRENSHWSELNKERCRWLIKHDLMTSAGFESLPDLDEEFKIDDEIKDVLMSDDEIWNNFNNFPLLYQRVRIGNIVRDRLFNNNYEKSLSNFVKKTKENKIYGDWNDNGRLLDDDVDII